MRLILCLLTCLCLSLPAFADYEAGKKAYDAGDYETAYEIWLPLAEEGNDKANIGIGNLYRRGLKFEYNFKKAEEYYLKAFDQKSPSVFFNLGKLYMAREDNLEIQKQGVIWMYVSKHLGHPLSQDISQIAMKNGAPKKLLEELEEKAIEWINNISTQ